MELVDNQNRIITESNKEGTLVGTSFDNKAMPLIRYLTDDTTHYLSENPDRIAKIESLRNKVYLDARNGQKVSITFLSISTLSNEILSFQFLQKSPGHLILSVIPSKKFTEKERLKIKKHLEIKIGNIMDIEVKSVKKLIHTPRGKIRNLVKLY